MDAPDAENDLTVTRLHCGMLLACHSAVSNPRPIQASVFKSGMRQCGHQAAPGDPNEEQAEGCGALLKSLLVRNFHMSMFRGARASS